MNANYRGNQTIMSHVKKFIFTSIHFRIGLCHLHHLEAVMKNNLSHGSRFVDSLGSDQTLANMDFDFIIHFTIPLSVAGLMISGDCWLSKIRRFYKLENC